MNGISYHSPPSHEISVLLSTACFLHLIGHVASAFQIAETGPISPLSLIISLPFLIQQCEQPTDLKYVELEKEGR